MLAAIYRARVNVKSLSSEAKFIRQEIRRARDTDAKSDLSAHRSMYVKPEARIAHLALAYLRNTPYRTAERKSRTEPDYNAISQKLRRYGVYNQTPIEIRQWLQE